MSKEKKEKRYHNGLQVDSDEEVLCLMWLEELQTAGYVLKIERADTFSLFDGLTNVYETEKQLKTKSKSVEHRQVLLAAHEYTPEFRVTWSPMAVDTFLWKPKTTVNEKFDKVFICDYFADGPVTYLEIKPEWDQNNMERLFKINQKWMYCEHDIFVNLVKPHKLCESTFTPTAWLTTPTGRKRVIHWELRTLEQYLQTLKS